MTIVPNRSTATCQNAACKQKVRLTDDLVRELSVNLQITVKCPKCETEFVTSLIPRVRERPAPQPIPQPQPTSPQPRDTTPRTQNARTAPGEKAHQHTPLQPQDVPHQVQTGVSQKQPPFSPLQAAQADSPPNDAPNTFSEPRATSSVQAPFQQLDPNAAGGSRRTTGAAGWWNRLPKKRQNLYLGVGLALAVGFAGVIQLRGAIFPAKQEEPEARTEPTTPATSASPSAAPKTPSTTAAATTPVTPPAAKTTQPSPPPGRPVSPGALSGERVQSNTRPNPPRPTAPSSSDNPFNSNRGR